MLDMTGKSLFPRLGTKKIIERTSYFFFRKCRKVQKMKRGTLWDSLTYIVAKHQNTRRGDSFDTLTNYRKKVAQCRKKSRGTLQSRPVL